MRLHAALKIAVPATGAAARSDFIRTRKRLWPYGLAAAATLAAVIAAAVFVSYPRESLAHAVATHADNEPDSFLTTAPVDPTDLARVLTTAGLQLLPGGPQVTYAQNCPLRGHTIAHFIVHSSHGPVVVLVMTHEAVRKRQAFSEMGYQGFLVPASKGSLAVLSTDARDLDEIVTAVEARIRYL